MKNNSIYNLCIGFLTLTTVALTGCEGDSKINTYEYPAPTVTRVTPTTGYAYSQVAIEGTNFGDRKESVTISFGGVEADSILSVQNNRIIVVVPKTAESGKMALKVWTHTLDSIADYTVLPTPEIFNIESNNAGGNLFAEVGDELTITGSGFGDAKENVKVTMAGIPAEVLSVTSGLIKARVPEGFNRGGSVVVTVKDYSVTGASFINPSATGDLTDLFLQNYKAPFERSVAGDSEWATARFWTFNNLAYGGHSLQFNETYPNGVLVFDGNGSWSGFNGGSTSQITTLPAGEYEFQIQVVEDHIAGGRYGANFGVMKDAAEFPTMTENTKDLSNNNQVYGPKLIQIDPNSANVLTCRVIGRGAPSETPYSCSMTLTETTQVRIGFATMLAKGNYVKVSYVKLIRK